ncbi:MAG: RagB/SusD family nutrient uptake outer membrane protein [Bacteroidota bacterium]
MKKIFILFALIGVLFASCAKELDVTPPNSITEEQIKALLASGDDETIKQVLGGLADALPAYFHVSAILGTGSADGRYYTNQGLDCMRNLEANDIVFGTKTTTAFGFAEYNFNDFTSVAVDKNPPYWYYCWNNITAANKILGYLTDDIVGENLRLKEYKARALTLRAYSYNYLMENYQDAYLQGGKDKLGIMLYDTYSPTQPYKARATAVETYDFILKDASDAVALFTAAGTGITAVKTDIDLAVADFVLARAALCAGEWATVITACDEIMGTYSSLMTEAMYVGTNVGGDSLDNPAKYLADNSGFLNIGINPEVILGWEKAQSVKAHNAWMNTFGGGSGGVSGLYQCIDNRLYEKIADDDYRKDNFLKEDYGDFSYPPNNVKSWVPKYANVKFANTHGVGSASATTNTAGDVGDYYMRTSEVLLMKAEAQAQSGASGEAENTLNVLLAPRTKAGAETLTCANYPSMAGMTIMQKIQLQSRIELWGENGREYYNNRRWNIPVDRTTSANHVVKLTYPVSGMTCQIPENEMNNNPLCIQN